jgi:prepilin-type N-terminal cleavage/methylation domain-containing protein
MNKSCENSGMTLIEIIVSLALIGILTLVFLTLFVGSLKMIGRSGERERVKVEASSSMDNLLNDSSYADSDITSATGSVTITYPDLTTKTVSGSEAKINKTNSDGSQVEIKGFIP